MSPLNYPGGGVDGMAVPISRCDQKAPTPQARDV